MGDIRAMVNELQSRNATSVGILRATHQMAIFLFSKVCFMMFILSECQEVFARAHLQPAARRPHYCFRDGIWFQVPTVRKNPFLKEHFD